MRDLFVIFWLVFMLAGYAATLFLESGSTLGLNLDLFLPLYVAMIAWVVLHLLKSPAAGREAVASERESAPSGGNPHA